MDNDLLKKRLRYQGAQYAAGSMARGGSEGPHMLTQAADIIENLEKEIERLKERINELVPHGDKVNLSQEQWAQVLK